MPLKMKGGDTALSLAEAAFVTGLTPRTVNSSIDRREIAPLARGVSGSGPRSLGYAELVYLALRPQISATLSRKARAALYRELKRIVSAQGERGGIKEVSVGIVRVPVRDAEIQMIERLEQLRTAERWVVSDPEIRGGEPVVRGTRVPVHRLAELVEKGASREEILEDHPAVGPEALDAALVYVRAYPRRGRPPRGPWRAGGNVSP